MALFPVPRQDAKAEEEWHGMRHTGLVEAIEGPVCVFPVPEISLVPKLLLGDPPGEALLPEVVVIPPWHGCERGDNDDEKSRRRGV